MINQIVLVGRLTRDPELAYTQSGIARCRFTLAVDRPYSNASGEKEVDFVDVVCWRKIAESSGKFLQKGLLTGVVGRLEIRSYEAQDGQKRRVTEVQANEVRFLEWAKPSEQAENTATDDDDNFDPDDLPF